MRKLCEAAGLSCKMTELYNRINDKSLDTKSQRLYTDKIPSAFKFYNTALSMIRYKEN